MGSLVRRNQGDTMRPTFSDPFQMMRELMSWDPFQPFDRAFGSELVQRAFAPAFELKETKNAFILKADLPGVSEDDLDVSLTGNRLTITGKREAERRDEGDQHFVYERSYGSFTRSFTLPDDCDPDHVDAELKNGVLTVQLPKKAEVQPRKISLKGMKEKVAAKLKA